MGSFFYFLVRTKQDSYDHQQISKLQMSYPTLCLGNWSITNPCCNQTHVSFSMYIFEFGILDLLYDLIDEIFWIRYDVIKLFLLGLFQLFWLPWSNTFTIHIS